MKGGYSFFRATISLTLSSFHTRLRFSFTMDSKGSVGEWPSAANTLLESPRVFIMVTNCCRTRRPSAMSVTSSNRPNKVTNVYDDKSGLIRSISTATFGFSLKYWIFFPYFVDKKNRLCPSKTYKKGATYGYESPLKAILLT